MAEPSTGVLFSGLILYDMLSVIHLKIAVTFSSSVLQEAVSRFDNKAGSSCGKTGVNKKINDMVSKHLIFNQP